MHSWVALNLFSSFDPTSSVGSMLNWVVIGLLLTATMAAYRLYLHKQSKIWIAVKKSFLNETNSLMKHNKAIGLFLNSLFVLVLLSNFCGLFPYIFTLTSHMSVTAAFSLTVWLALMTFGLANKNKNMFAHLVPSSTPNMLMPFMVLIESISLLIRPLTLAIRLSANMIAGHLLMTLLGERLADLSMLGLMFPVELMLVSLEMAVSLIQAYVFAILLTLYISEIGEDS